MFKKGSILVIVLCSLMLLSSFAVIMGYGLRQKISLVQRLNSHDILRITVEAGIYKAIAQLKSEEAEDYYALKGTLSNNPQVFKRILVGDSECSIQYIYVDAFTNTVQPLYGLIDEERKININTASVDVLKRLFQILLAYDEIQAQELAASIIDWRDSDSDLSIPIGSAEDAYYRNTSFPYESKDAPFESLDEIFLVKGVTESVFERLKGYITIYGDGKVNINTTSSVVLAALGLSEELVRKIAVFRAGKDATVGTDDDNIFDTPATIVSKLQQMFKLSEAEITQLEQVIERVTTNANYFTIISVVQLPNRDSLWHATCITNREGEILYWQGL